MNIRNYIKKPLLYLCHKRYEKELTSFKLSYPGYLKQIEAVKSPKENTRKASQSKEICADTDTEICFFYMKNRKGELISNVIPQIQEIFKKNSEVMVLYADEDRITSNGERHSPHYRPDWSPDTFTSRYYFGSFVAIRKKALSETKQLQFNERNEYILDEKSLWDLCSGIISYYGGFQPCKEKKCVYHLPEIVFCRNNNTQNTTNTKREDIKTSVTELGKINKKTAVSIIIPSKDQPDILKACVTSIRKTVSGEEIQILVIDNGSSLKHRESIKYLSQQMDFEYIYHPMEFHFARMCNMAAQKAKGELLLFLNDDIECITLGWIESMISIAEKEYVGAVGAKLYYPNSTKLQHAGITNLPLGPVHKLQFLSDDRTYYDEYNRGNRNVLAVTGACLMIRSSLYREVGGMCEKLAVAFNDVDLCFQLHEMGYYNVVVQDYPLWHHESISRGADDSEEKWLRLMREKDILYKRHPQLIGTDPYYSIHLNQRGLDTRILPSFYMGKAQSSPIIFGEPINLPENARKDDCLLLRIENVHELDRTEENPAGSNLIEGYGVILGSDNSLYKKSLLLRNKAGRKEIYQFKISPVYRNDLEENMPDQIRVALSGFSIRLDCAAIPSGYYEIGMMAKDLTGRMILVNWSNRSLKIIKSENIEI